VISDSASSEVLEGGPGKDVLTLSPHLWSECDRRPVATATPVLDVGAHTVTGLGTDTFSGFETYRTGPYTQELIGSSGPDRFVSGCGRNTILGHGGRDTIVADSCNVSIKAGPGADIIKFQATGTVRGGAGADIVRLPLWEDKNCRGHAMAVSGGPGRDWVAFPGQEARFVTVIDLRNGLLQSPSGSLHIQLAQMENVLTSGRGFPGHRQLIIGTAGSNVLIGRDGPTTLRGLGGNDVLDGAGGRDSAYGGKGHDICRAEVRHQCEASR
jgi:Ca2+-binding RTX toxin-like protein